MPFRLRLSAKRFIAGVGGYAAAPSPTTSPRNGVPPAVALCFSLPMMRSATSHTASIAPTISCLPTTTSSSRHSSCAVSPGSTRARPALFGSSQHATAGSGRPNILSLGNQEPLLLQPTDDLGSGRRRANTLGFLQAIPQNLVINKTPGILHSLDQSAFVVTRRRPGLLVLNFWILQLRGLAVAQRRQQLRLIALFVGGLPLRECCAPAEINGLATGCAKFKAVHIE